MPGIDSAVLETVTLCLLFVLVVWAVVDIVNRIDKE